MNDASLETKVLAWLQTQGYPLEMRVAEAFRQKGFTVVQSGYYPDPITGKPRELDVVAFRRWNSANVSWQFTLLIECKVAKKGAWVLFTRELTHDDTEGQFHYYRAPASTIARPLLGHVRRRIVDKALVPLLDFAERPGYGLQHAPLGDKDTRGQGEDRRDVAFDTASKVAVAAQAHADLVNSEGYDETPVGSVVLPIIVIDGALVDVHLNSTGEPEAVEIQHGILDWQNPAGGKSPTWIRIVTMEKVAALVEDAARTADYLQHECGDAIERIDKRWMEQFEARLRRTAAGAASPDGAA